MKFLEFIQSIFVPQYMVKRKGMNIFLSLFILLLLSTLMALPMINYFSKDRYNLLDDSLNLKVFNYVVNKGDVNGAFTEEEMATYNMTYFDDFKAFDVKANKNGIYVPEDSAIENGKEYVFKSYVPITGDDGNISKYETYYIHIVVDDYDAKLDEEPTYSIQNVFCKYKREEDGTFHHFLVAIYNDGIIFSLSDQTGDAVSLYYNKSTQIYFDEAEDMTYVSHALSDLFYRVYITQASRRTFLYVFLFPILLCWIFSFVMKGTSPLVKAKEFIAVGVIASITCVCACLIASFISMKMCNYAFQYYPFLFVGYYLVCIILINRRARLTRMNETTGIKEVR